MNIFGIKIKIMTIIKSLPVIFMFLLILNFSLVTSFFDNTNQEIENARNSSNEVTQLILELDKVNLDTSILNNPYFNVIQSIPDYPLDVNNINYGKINPFQATLNIATPKQATSSVGGVVNSNQRGGGSAIRTVNLNNNR